MYESFYGFKKRPFELIPDPDFLYRSDKHKAALTHLEYGILDRAGFIVITGEIGTGKTVLIRYMLRSFKTDMPVAYLSQTLLDPEEFLKRLCQEFSLPCDGRGKPGLLELLESFLVTCFEKGRYAIVILDEAQNLPVETLEEIRMLSNLDAENRPLLQIILVGQPILRDMLRWRGLRQLAQRVQVCYHLEPLDPGEVNEYIRYRLRKSGGENPDLFERGAIEAISHYSQGVPRLINTACHMCLVYAMADELDTIGRDVVEAVLRDRARWGLLSGEGVSEKSAIQLLPGQQVNPCSTDPVLSRLDGKVDRCVEISEATTRALERIASALPPRANGKEVGALKERLATETRRVEMLQNKLTQVEQQLAAIMRNQKRLAELLMRKKKTAPVPGRE
jgi:general secretion pathway protein A